MICQGHWDALREAVAARGLADLVAGDGELAAAQLADQLKGREATPANFDPLMAAYWSIGSNAMETMGGNALYLLAPPEVPEDPVVGYGDAYEGRTWPRCAICYLNLAHEMTCRDERCLLDRERGYDRWVDNAADDARAKAVELGMVEA